MRIRSIKPDFFRHRGLFLAEQEYRLPLRVAFAGLWGCADRLGRFKWDLDMLKLDCLPWDVLDFGAVLNALAEKSFVVRFEADGRRYGYIPSFLEHQRIPKDEAKSTIPNPPPLLIHSDPPGISKDPDGSIVIHQESPRIPMDPPSGREGKGDGKEGSSEANASGAAAPAEGAEPAQGTLPGTPPPKASAPKSISPEAKRLVEFIDSRARAHCPDYPPLYPLVAEACIVANRLVKAHDPLLLRFLVSWGWDDEFWKGQVMDVLSLSHNLKKLLAKSATDWVSCKKYPELWDK